MPAKASTEANAPAESETEPTDLSHVRVGPPFESKIDGRCVLCSKPTLGIESAVIENSRSKKKRVAHEACLSKRPDLLACREVDDIGSFLAA